jgi:hypothetical protein
VIPEQAEALQIEMWRRLPLEERLQRVFAMIEDGFALAASIRVEHPSIRPRNSGSPCARGST